MSIDNFNRRRFLQSVALSGLIYGTGGGSRILTNASAAPAALNKKTLVNLDLGGGPDLRHLIVPAYDSNEDSFGAKYWKHRARAHKLEETGVTAQQRYENDYVEFQVGDSSWSSSGLVDATYSNSSVKFGIWKEASWLIDMFSHGNVALVFNASPASGNRGHNVASLRLRQGNIFGSLNKPSYSGWGGRLARSAGGNAISLKSLPSPFLFGPEGDAPNYINSKIDNKDLRSLEYSRDLGLFVSDYGANEDQIYKLFQNTMSTKMARAVKSYYGGLQKEIQGKVYQKAMDHERNIREFGDQLNVLLTDDNIPIPPVILSLYKAIPGMNDDPNITNKSRRVIKSISFGNQIRNLYDMIAVNNIKGLNPRVLSMHYNGWDTHSEQRLLPAALTEPISDLNTLESRGIETFLRDIFGGKFGSNPHNPSALHCGFSALWSSLPSSDRSNIVITIAGEFGRQIRDNGGSGTDHGGGNLMLVVGENVRGGVYGKLFPDEEVDKYDDMTLTTPDIATRTDIDPLFAKVCDWVEPNSGQFVFPRTASNYNGDLPLIEMVGMFDNLMIG